MRGRAFFRSFWRAGLCPGRLWQDFFSATDNRDDGDKFERAIAEMGQSMGVTATGLLLLRIVDPDCKTRAAEAFAYKQLLHEPFMGGGLWTGAAIPLLAFWGVWPVFGIALFAGLFWLGFLRILSNAGTTRHPTQS